MNATQLQAWVQQNKVAVLGVAGAGVVVLGLRARGKSGGAPAAGGGYAAGTAADSAFATGPAIAGTVPYNSSATDAYNALMPAITRLYELQEKANPPIPTPDPGYYRLAGASSTYYIDDKGNRDFLTLAEYNALGRPARKDVPRDSPLWTSTKLIGDDNPTVANRAPVAATSPI